MAKRSRVSGRPSGRARPARPAAPPSRPAEPAVERTPIARQSSALTEEETRRAAELEAELVAQEKAAARARSAAVAARGRRAGIGRELDPEIYNQPLSVRAAREYAYVARDVRRIAITGGLMLAILIALAIAVNVAGVIKI